MSVVTRNTFRLDHFCGSAYALFGTLGWLHKDFLIDAGGYADPAAFGDAVAILSRVHAVPQRQFSAQITRGGLRRAQVR